MMVRLNIKAMIRVEAMLNKPFVSLDYSNPDDVDTLLYCCALSVNKAVPVDLFKLILKNNRKRDEMSQELAVANIVASQFSIEGEKEDSTEASPQWIRDIAAVLIAEGVDVNYLLNDMELPELSLMIKAAEAKRIDRLESSRLWTFLTVWPHLSKNSKIKSPEDLFPFPWEAEKRKEAAEKSLQENSEVFLAFMKGDFNHIMQS